MTIKETIVTPVGRLVWGSLYVPQKTDFSGQPLIYKTGKNVGQPRGDFIFCLAIEKILNHHWSQTEWGEKILRVAQLAFPAGQFNLPTFSWKIVDGDSTVLSLKNNRPCDLEGHPGHWIIRFKSSFAIGIYNRDGTQQILEKDAVNPGDYIQVFADITANNNLTKPGVYINPLHVAFSYFGKRIQVGVDVKSIGFGRDTIMPAGASLTPVAGNFNPAPAPVNPFTSQAQVAPVIPHHGILTPRNVPVPPVPSVPPKPVRVMLPAAGKYTYDEYIAIGWTDETLIQNGYMQG